MAKPNKKKRKTSPVIILVLIVLTVVIGVQCVRVYKQLDATTAEANSLAQQVEERTEENENLKEDLDKADDISFIKRLARSMLGLVESNERVFYDVND